jgi:hypothetical protein
MGARADKCNQFGLQVSPRGEQQEVTRVTRMLDGVGVHIGIDREVVDSEVR